MIYEEVKKKTNQKRITDLNFKTSVNHTTFHLFLHFAPFTVFYRSKEYHNLIMYLKAEINNYEFGVIGIRFQYITKT